MGAWGKGNFDDDTRDWLGRRCSTRSSGSFENDHEIKSIRSTSNKDVITFSLA